ncbi:lysophospholipid acyltransferase family protein [Polaribacter dokdonensis]|uniref:KDO2-lipid IV(A) lauroyltransferase n=2 Tax=Polaribacter dokdonensis DSW-5 TaxID=1300348 RepID=A0A1H5IMW3_9FLAO|nr:lysophospholipid acyltransferase family protein [Polaribacter dokdonensis]SEE41231.1 KDO2-lipid IV(A) lauroyltransferase [Polaribacter dokdonensis DSW-5]
MQYLFFLFLYPIIWLISKIPMRILHVISSIIFVFVYYIFSYRKKLVLDNLKLAFPDKKLKEILRIRKEFFKHFSDLFIETLKAISISEKEILRRYKYSNPELVNKYINQGRSIALVSAHQANWEWSVNSPLVLKTCVNGAYTKIGNRFFNKTVKASRERFGFKCYESTKTVKAIYSDFKNKIQGAYLLISDQSPQVEHTLYWKEFFGVKVPFHVGAETLSKKFNLVVINCATKRVKRGFYETTFELIAEHPNEFENYKITDKYISLTEQLVREQPEFYLWSHKRFKHKDKYEIWEKNKKVKLKNKVVK